jgi:hypothetical protein
VFVTLDCRPGTTVAAGPEPPRALIDSIVASFQGSRPTGLMAHAATRIPTARQAARLITGSWLSARAPCSVPPAALVHLRGEGVQWNPVDHPCVAGQVLVTP